MENKYIRIPIVVIITIIVVIVICINFVKKQEENIGEDTSVNMTTKFEISDITAKSGDEITINIKMLEDSIFVAGNFELLYDSKKLEYVEYEEGDILKAGAMSIINNDEDNNKILIAYISNIQNETAIVKNAYSDSFESLAAILSTISFSPEKPSNVSKTETIPLFSIWKVVAFTPQLSRYISMSCFKKKVALPASFPTYLSNSSI